MEEGLLPKRSPEALAVLDIFYDEFNDVHFFVEDEDQENLYEVILRRMFPELKIARVFPLGGKQAVLDHVPGPNKGDTKPRSIYLVDKDFDDLLGTKVEKQGLFYLNRYCIENYFADPDAILEFVVETIPKLKRPEIAANLDLSTKLNELMESLRPLFQMFYCVQRFELGLKNCSLPAEKFCSAKHRWHVDPVALSNYRTKIITAASCTQHAVALADPLSNPEIAGLAQLDSHRVISGKHLCTLIFHFLKSKYNLGSITFESFLFRICKNSSLHALSDLAAEIRIALAPVKPAAR
jgi:Protein of unknown function (DUF4435)